MPIQHKDQTYTQTINSKPLGRKQNLGMHSKVFSESVLAHSQALLRSVVPAQFALSWLLKLRVQRYELKYHKKYNEKYLEYQKSLN